MTDSGRMQRVEELFHRAMALPAAERTVRVAEWCGADEALCRDVLELLAAEQQVDQAMAAGAASQNAEPVGEPEEEAWSGRVVGSYRLLRMLGRGGMGVVYLAESQGSGLRAQGSEGQDSQGGRQAESNSSRVAIKFVRRSLRGSPAIQHFLMERDALAALQHPNIARLLDAGVARDFAGDDAVPYVVMEFIEGRRLDEVCDAPEMDVPGVVGLTLQLCDAVGFVHRNLLLHRDLKPGNVMVNGEGVVKLLDFGTLKMLGKEAQPSAMTQAGMRPLTLRYAAPEHVLGAGMSGLNAEAAPAPMTTAADVYSLGMVLYRVLGGRLPPELEDRDILQWFEHLKNRAVTTPSQAAPGALRAATQRELAADLDAIALKAIRYEPAERYGSAQAMADDLRRALDARPVLARGDSTRYRLRKVYARNKSAFWAGTAAAAVMLAGVLAMRHETAIAQAQERTASAGVEQERALAHTLLFDYFDQLRALPGSTDAQKRAVTEALAYLNGLSDAQRAAGSRGRVESTRELQMDQVQGYTSMGSVLGSPYEDNLGQPDAAVKVLQNGVALARELAARYPNDTDVLKAQASVNQTLGNVYVGQVRMKDAMAADTEAAKASERLAAQGTATAADLAVAASAHDAMGDLLNGRDGSSTFDPARSEQLYNQALAFDRRELVLDPNFFRARRGVAVELHKLGLLLENTDPVASTAQQQKALDWLNAFSPQDRAKPAVSRLYYAIEQHVGQMDVRIGKTREGLARMEDVLARYRAVYAADPINDQALFDVVEMESNLGEAYGLAGMNTEAIASLRACVDHLALLLKHDPRNANWGYREALVRYRLAAVMAGANSTAPTPAITPTNAMKQEAAALLEFAREPDFNASDLPDVLEAMNVTRIEPELALALARRLLAAAPDLDSYGVTMCAQAAEIAGAQEEAQQQARRALEKLSHENVATAQQRADMAADETILRKPGARG